MITLVIRTLGEQGSRDQGAEGRGLCAMVGGGRSVVKERPDGGEAGRGRGIIGVLEPRVKGVWRFRDVVILGFGRGSDEGTKRRSDSGDRSLWQPARGAPADHPSIINLTPLFRDPVVSLFPYRIGRDAQCSEGAYRGCHLLSDNREERDARRRGSAPTRRAGSAGRSADRRTNVAQPPPAVFGKAPGPCSTLLRTCAADRWTIAVAAGRDRIIVRSRAR